MAETATQKSMKPLRHFLIALLFMISIGWLAYYYEEPPVFVETPQPGVADRLNAKVLMLMDTPSAMQSSGTNHLIIH
jgi:hypothetical protein